MADFCWVHLPCESDYRIYKRRTQLFFSKRTHLCDVQFFPSSDLAQQTILCAIRLHSRAGRLFRTLNFPIKIYLYSIPALLVENPCQQTQILVYLNKAITKHKSLRATLFQRAGEGASPAFAQKDIPFAARAVNFQ